MLEITNLSKSYKKNQVLKDTNITVNDGEMVALLGPSGSGKTTILRIVAGFIESNGGDVKIDGKSILNQEAYKRNIGVVFQNYALFPHMTVKQNVEFGLKMHKVPVEERKNRVEEALKVVDMLPYANRYPNQLSGGQQQRVAIARVVAIRAKLMLLDEPLSNLDAKLRRQVRVEIKELQRKLKITTVIVTHDQEEALTMSDKIVVMQKGEILQIGTPQEIYNEPTNRFVANFIGESNIISGRMIEDYKVRFDDITFDCVDHGFKENEPVDVVIRPEDIDIVDVKDGKMTGEVLSVLFKGVHYEIMVETVPGTSVTVNMRVIRNHDVTSEDGSEKISANNFYVDVEDVENLDDKEIIALSNAQAWETETDEYISIANIEYELEAKEGQYPVTFSTSNGTSIERTIFVVNQPFVKNEKANEGVMAFNFFKTVDEITESQALDTDLKTWANAQGWKLTDEDQSVDISVDYDFDPEEVTEGVYEITFSTTGREFKIHTTDYSEEGQEVGLTFFPEDIHVMPKVVF